MSLGLAPRQADMLTTTTSFCEGRVAEDSIYGILHRDGHRLFADEMFADLFCDGRGRRSVPPSIVATVMVLQRIEGCSDREAVDRFTFDVRWKYAAGGLGFDHPGFVHTVLVDMRARLAASEHPDRIFDVVLEAAKEAGLVGRRRVLDSTALYDAVATMDTVTLVRSAIRGVLKAAGEELETELRGVLGRDEDYAQAGKPVCDYDDPEARAQLIDALVKDARAVLVALDGRELSAAVSEAARVLAAVVGQDLDEDDQGTFKIARRVAKDRIISTVDTDARHGHKTQSRSFDGYKAHVSIDPDSELVTATAVTAGNVADGEVAEELLAGDLDSGPGTEGDAEAGSSEPAGRLGESERLAVYGDGAYGAGTVLAVLEQADAQIMCKTQTSSAPGGRFTKDDFHIDLDGGKVTCPAGQVTTLGPGEKERMAYFGAACASCPLLAHCTTSKNGRTITVGPYERQLAAARACQADPAWQADYKATRPIVERKQAHMMRRRHGGRRARVRGETKVTADHRLLAAAANLARLAVLRLAHQPTGWTTATA